MINKKEVIDRLKYLDAKDYQLCLGFLKSSRYEPIKELVDTKIYKMKNTEEGSDSFVELCLLSDELSKYVLPEEELTFYEDEE